MIVIAGSASPKLAARTAKLLKCKLIKPELKQFPDGETYVRIAGELKDEHAVVIQSTPNPQNDNLIELFLLLGAAKNLGARQVTAVVPYLAYARQDKRFKSGEAISAQTVCKLIERAGADELFVVDVHQANVLKNFSIPAHELTAASLIGQYIKKLNLKNPLFLAADQGAYARARRAAAVLGAEVDYLMKKRITPTEVTTLTKYLDVVKRDVVIIDDIISTGGTNIEAAKILKQNRARRIYAACTHAILAGDAMRRIISSGVTRIIATDTIENQVGVVSVAPIIAEAIIGR